MNGVDINGLALSMGVVWCEVYSVCKLFVSNVFILQLVSESYVTSLGSVAGDLSCPDLTITVPEVNPQSRGDAVVCMTFS